jgi:hypothetical protein
LRPTIRIAKVVSDAISHPRQDSATGYARAALATRAGQDGRLRVVAIEELRADELGHPRRRALPRTAQVATDGVDIGVALGVPDDHSCLLGARIPDAVVARSASWRSSPRSC